MFNHYIKLSVLGVLLVIADKQTAQASWYPRLRETASGNEERAIGKFPKIVDEYGKPISGAKIYDVKLQLVGETDENGDFSLRDNAIHEALWVEYPGYYRKKIKGGSEKSVSLVPAVLQRTDSLHIGYDKKKSSELLGAVSVVYNSQIKDVPTPLYLNALTGRMPGLFTQEVSGFRSPSMTAITSNDLAGSLPSDAVKYRSSIGDNTEIGFNLRGQSPVTMIDGVQRDIYSIDPENIESVTVVKDALSSILLGQRSSRGILQVTTKKGQAGPPRISFTAQTGIQQSLKMPQPLNAYQYAYLYNEALLNAGRQPVYSSDDFKAFRDGTNSLFFPDVNWYDAVVRDNNPTTKYNLGVKGGIKNARYALSLSYLNQYGLFKSDDKFDYETNVQNKRYLINSAIDVDVTDDLTIGLQFFGKIQDGRQPGAKTGTILSTLYNTPNNAYPIFNPDQSYGGSSVYRSNLYQLATGSGYLLDNTRDLLANLDFNYKLDKFVPGLYAKGKLNVSSTSSSLIDRNRQQPVYDLSYNEQKELVYVRYGTIADQPNSFATTSTANFFYFQGALGYDKQVSEKHRVGAKLFMDRQTANYQFDLPAIYTNFAATANYAYQDKYFAEVALNYSGFNRFMPGNQYGLFYAFGLGWDMLQEDFLKEKTDWLSQLKWRATFGRTGNTNEAALGYYSWRASYGQDGANGYDFGSEYAYTNSLIEKGLANIEGTWEKGNKFNIGLDAAFWHSTLKLTADYFRDTYFDLLQQRGSTIDLIGIGYPNENIGKNRYEGQEISLTYQNNFGEFNYFITANASRMKTQVLYMNEVFQQYDWNWRTGMPVGQTFGYRANGLIQTQDEADHAPLLSGNKVYPGDVKLVDLNGDGIINQYDQTAIGNTKPLVYFGTTLGFNVAGFDFSVLLQGVLNRSYQQTDYSFGNTGDGQGFDYMLGRWTPETGTAATYPRLTLGPDPTNTQNISSYWTRSGEYLRVRNLDVGYTLPFNWTKRAKLSSVRIFANAQNLFTFTPYGRLDPEISSGTAYPAQRIISFGVNVKL